MKLVRTSPFIDIEFDDINKLMKLSWKKESSDMDNDIFKQEMLEYIKLFELKPQKILQQMTDMQFSIVPELQDWINEEVNPKALAAGVKKAAFILSTEIFTSVSVQQGLSDFDPNSDFVGYFDNESDAMTWLLKN